MAGQAEKRFLEDVEDNALFHVAVIGSDFDDEGSVTSITFNFCDGPLKGTYFSVSKMRESDPDE